MYDWSPYFGDYAMVELLTAASAAVVFISPLVLLRVSYRWAIEFVRRVARTVV